MLTSQSIREVCSAHAASHADESFYLLADHAGMPGLHRWLGHTKLEWASLFEGTKQANAMSVAPLLVRIRSGPRDLSDGGFLTWVSGRGAFSSCLMLLASPLSSGELAGRLTARLDAKISDDMDVLLRFFDPRVFAQLMRSLSDEQRHVFLCAASSWWYVDRYGDLQAVEAQFSNEETFNSPLVLSARQEFELVDASESDQIEEQLRASVPNEIERLTLPERHTLITHHSAAARDFQITSTRELALYCAVALTYGAHFASTPEWSSRLSSIREGNQNLTDVVACLQFQQE